MRRCRRICFDLSYRRRYGFPNFQFSLSHKCVCEVQNNSLCSRFARGSDEDSQLGTYQTEMPRGIPSKAGDDVILGVR